MALVIANSGIEYLDIEECEQLTDDNKARLRLLLPYAEIIGENVPPKLLRPVTEVEPGASPGGAGTGASFQHKVLEEELHRQLEENEPRKKYRK